MQTTIDTDTRIGTTGTTGTTDEDWQPTDAPRSSSTVGRGVVVVLVLAVVAAGALLGLRSGGNDDSEPSSSRAAAPTAPPTTAPATNQPADQAPAAPAPGRSDGTDAGSEEAASLEDGRHPVYLTGIDTTAGTLEFDVVQWFTGEAAIEYVEAHEDEYPDWYEAIEETGHLPYDDLMVVNENPRLRTLPVAPDTEVQVLQGPDHSYLPHTIDFAELPAHFEQLHYQLGEFYTVFWLTVQDGDIVAIEEQFGE
jgi:hypothetical protein